jgi:hypothetical protein
MDVGIPAASPWLDNSSFDAQKFLSYQAQNQAASVSAPALLAAAEQLFPSSSDSDGGPPSAARAAERQHKDHKKQKRKHKKSKYSEERSDRDKIMRLERQDAADMAR